MRQWFIPRRVRAARLWGVMAGVIHMRARRNRGLRRCGTMMLRKMHALNKTERKTVRPPIGILRQMR